MLKIIILNQYIRSIGKFGKAQYIGFNGFNGFNRKKSLKFYLPKQKAPLFLGALFVKSKAKFSR
ncbi:hypothetical protein D0A37_20195 [Microcoleus vaginatus HSN003]|nr:hypothetical protein D0A37_20195 [Microcoleus vaginatus HSN003]